jgi:mannose/fructose/N-acetylgalactosamine-specific phosphotransferase system component IIC
VKNPPLSGGGFFIDNRRKILILRFNMPERLILTCVLGGLVALDDTEAFQSLLAQPLLIGPLVGLIFNDILAGLKIGILFQLMYLWVMPIGTAILPDSGIGSVVGCAGFILLDKLFPESSSAILLLLILFVFVFSLFSGWTLIKQRQFNSRLLSRAVDYGERIRLRGFDSLFLLALGGSFLRGLIITAFGILLIFILLEPAMNWFKLIPEQFLQHLELPLWGLGLGGMAYLFGRKRNLPWFFAGVLLGIVFLFL